MSSDWAGETIASRCAVVIRGISKPLLLPGAASTSSNAEALGVAPVVLMPMFCAKASAPDPLQKKGEKKMIATTKKCFIFVLDISALLSLSLSLYGNVCFSGFGYC